MNVRSNIKAKSAYERCIKREDVELEKDNVSCAYVECFESGLFLCQFKDSLEDKHIGQEYKDHIKPKD